MINFRYHVVSLIAVFLALAIGVIMGSAVIDRAIVDRLEDQQQSLQEQVDGVEASNDALREENRVLRETAEQLAEEGGPRLLAGSLTDVPVLVLATRGVEPDGFDNLLNVVTISGADRRGTLWFTDRFALDDDDEVADLAAALEAPSTLSATGLRTLALTRLTTMLRQRAGAADAVDEQPVAGDDASTPGGTDPLLALRDAGFLDFDAPDGRSADLGPQVTGGTRLVLASGGSTDDLLTEVAAAVAELLVEDRAEIAAVSLLATEQLPAADDEGAAFVERLRDEDEITARLSTVDNIGDFAGRLAAVLSIVDLGDARVGHYGRGPGAERLIPAPPEAEG